MANNLIQIKRSLTTNIPASLANGEMAYTANGDVLYIGSNATIVAIGGKRTPGTATANQALVVNSTFGIDRATIANATIGAIYANSSLGSNGMYLATNGSVVFWQAPSGGGTVTQVNTGIGLTGGPITGTGTVSVVANNGIVANATGLWVNGSSTVVVNATGVHVNPSLSITDLTLSGNLTINGTLTAVDATNMAVNDSIIELGRNNSANTLDLGFYGQYSDGTTRYVGLAWDASNNVFELFANTTAEPTTTINPVGTGYTRATLVSFLNSGGLVSNGTNIALTANSTLAVAITGNTLTLTTALAATSGGTGQGTYTSGDILVANTGNALSKLALGGSGFVLQSNGTAVVYATLDGGTF
jgi:hypothetical protein